MQRLLAFALLLTLSSCDTVAPDPTEAAAAAPASAGRWIHQVSGGGQDLYPGNSDTEFVITLNARQNAQGVTEGQVAYGFPAGRQVHGPISCLEVRGNRAFVTFAPEDGPLAGYTIFYGVEDNGEGAAAPVDRHTFIYGYRGAPTSDLCLYFANNLAALGGFPVEWTRGNVQVR